MTQGGRVRDKVVAVFMMALAAVGSTGCVAGGAEAAALLPLVAELGSAGAMVGRGEPGLDALRAELEAARRQREAWEGEERARADRLHAAWLAQGGGRTDACGAGPGRDTVPWRDTLARVLGQGGWGIGAAVGGGR